MANLERDLQTYRLVAAVIDAAEEYQDAKRERGLRPRPGMNDAVGVTRGDLIEALIDLVDARVDMAINRQVRPHRPLAEADEERPHHDD